MKSTVYSITIKLVTLLMIGIMGILIVNKTVFLHVHKLDDGTIIFHAHPFDKSKDSKPYKSHHHSKTGFLFFQNLNILFLIAFLTIALIEFDKKEKTLIILTLLNTLINLNLNKGRAPPIS